MSNITSTEFRQYELHKEEVLFIAKQMQDGTYKINPNLMKADSHAIKRMFDTIDRIFDKFDTTNN